MMRRVTDRLRRLAAGVVGGAGPVILMYHRVATPRIDPWGLAVSPENFRAQMQVVKRRRRPVSLDHMVHQVLQGKPEPDTIAITFDDAYRDVLVDAKPVLTALDIPATVFVVSGKLGDAEGFWWDRLASAVLGGPLPHALPPLSFAGARAADELADALRRGRREDLHLRLWSLIKLLGPAAREAAVDDVVRAFGSTAHEAAPVMSETDLKSLVESGLITIGAHSATHPSLSALSADDQRAEILESQGRLAGILGEPIRRLAYPFGDYDERSIEIARDLDFDYAVSVETEPLRDRSARFRLPRQDVKNWTGPEFERRLRWRM